MPSLSLSQSHQQSSHVAMTLFGHDPLVSQETHKRVIPKFVQQMFVKCCRRRRHRRCPNRTNNHHMLL
jgi:CTP:molybdopterin cytidylyltransferase MocA